MSEIEYLTEDDLQDLEDALPALVEDVIFRNGANVRHHLEHEVPRMIATIRACQRDVAERDGEISELRRIVQNVMPLVEALERGEVRIRATMSANYDSGEYERWGHKANTTLERYTAAHPNWWLDEV